MTGKTHLYVLWTNGNPVTAEKMVFMYTINSLIKGWWKKVTLIIWGEPAKLVSEDTTIEAPSQQVAGNLRLLRKMFIFYSLANPAASSGECARCSIQKKITEALDAGVHVTACKACADQLGVTETLEKLQIEVKYWGLPLTELLKSNERLLTI